MSTIMLAITAMICYAAIYFSYYAQAKYKKGMLFAVTLPEYAVSHPELLQIKRRFLKQHNLTALSLLAAFVPCVALHGLHAYQVIYFFVWLIIFIPAIAMPFRGAFRATLALKRENDWFTGEKRVINGDLRLTVLKNARAAPLSLFVIPLIMSMGLTAWAYKVEPSLYWISFGGAAATLLLFLITVSLLRGKAVVYSANTDINLALNQSKRRTLSYLWLLIACIEVLFFGALFLIISQDWFWYEAVLAALILMALIQAGLIISAYNRIQELERDVLAADNQTIYTDDDEYWANGFTYHNPNDPRIIVAKRVGIGETINTGTTAGKIIAGAIVSLFAGAMLFVSVMLILSETSMPSMTVDAEAQQVRIDYPMYSTEFRADEIQEIALINELPSMLRINGESTERYARGHFRLAEDGTASIYVIKNNPPYIRIKLQDVYIIYNEEQPELTRTRFEEIEAITR